MDIGTIINSIGLLLDIVGAALIFFFGISPKIDRDGLEVFHFNTAPNETEIKKAQKYDFCSNIGIIMLMFGFALQLISNFL